MPNDKHLRPFDPGNKMASIGSGLLGGKAQGLAFIHEVLKDEFDTGVYPEMELCIPRQVSIRTDIFDEFMQQNDLYEIAYSDKSDTEIALAFQEAKLPTKVLSDLQVFLEEIQNPLAVRSSSLLEDATYRPFAGIYVTKMISNNQKPIDARLQKLVEAIKLVYASTYYRAAKDYIKATKHNHRNEKMAVIIQEIIGKQHGQRYYPELSGVARSYNYYPLGRAKHEQGVVYLALGLGKTIVDGGITWTYSPAYPKATPPYRWVEELLKQSQTKFWAVNMAETENSNPIDDSEYLLHGDLQTAELDDTLRYLASTYDAQSNRLMPGISFRGPRVLTFAPLLVWEEFPINKLVTNLLSNSEKAFDGPVEIEFAMTFDPHRFSFLQVRPMIVPSTMVTLTEEDLVGGNVLVASKKVLGNGTINNIRDIVYIKPDRFETKHTSAIALELAKLNEKLLATGRSYLLIVFGRLGTTDPWLGIPTSWGQVSGAKVIVEATREDFIVDLSQGSHFFHNLTSFGVSYFTVPVSNEYQIDWEWLFKQRKIEETEFACHAKTLVPMLMKIDGRKGQGVIYKL